MGYIGVIALAIGIGDSEKLLKLTFGDKQAVTMTADMTEANFNKKGLGVSGAILISTFLPKCT
jgi:hypothetical protein